MAVGKKVVMDWSDIFGEEALTAEQFEVKVKGMKLVDLADGKYVGKDKLDSAVKSHKDREKALSDELADLKTATDGDDGLRKQVSKLEADLKVATEAKDEAEKTATEATGKATRAEREKLAREKIADPKLARLALLDAEAMVTDEVDFSTALAKVIADDTDYQDSGDMKQVSGKETKGSPANVDPLTQAVIAAVGK